LSIKDEGHSLEKFHRHLTYPLCTGPSRCGLHPLGRRGWRYSGAQPRCTQSSGFPAPCAT
jgi:hypothetical protein